MFIWCHKFQHRRIKKALYLQLIHLVGLYLRFPVLRVYLCLVLNMVAGPPVHQQLVI